MTSTASESSRGVTLRDVAARAGVTVSTVSKALNGRRDVGETSRARILAVAEEMGYRPNAIARGLRTRRSEMIAIVTDDLEGIFTTAMMRGVEDAASDAGVGVLLCNSYGEPERERTQLRRLLERQIDALIFMSGNRVRPRPDPALPIPDGVPVVYLYEYGPPSIRAILPDDEGGARLAVDHLIACGRRRIAYIDGPVGWEAAADRLRGYRRAAHTTDGLVEAARSWTPEEGYRTMKVLLNRRPDLDAVFCSSDELAAGAMSALHDRGIRIPDEVQVVGYDDRSLAVHQRPALTTVALPLHEMGLRAGAAVLGDLGSRGGGVDRVPCTLVVRESTAGMRA